jgi:hypothetical protein
MKITLRDKDTGEFATEDGWTCESSDAIVFAHFWTAQSFCDRLLPRRVEAVVERPNGNQIVIQVTQGESIQT